MALKTVYLSPDSAPGKLRIVTDAPSLVALVAPPVFLIWHRLWWPLAIYGLVASALALLAWRFEHPAIAMLGVLPGLYLMLEGRNLLRRRLEDDGWREAGVVEAADDDEALLRLFGNEREPVAPVVAPAPAEMAAAEPTTPRPVASLGIFPE